MNLQELISHVAQRPEVRSSLTDLLHGIAELIREHQEAPLKLEALADDLDGSETLALAVVANTPVAPSGIGNPIAPPASVGEYLRKNVGEVWSDPPAAAVEGFGTVAPSPSLLEAALADRDDHPEHHYAPLDPTKMDPLNREAFEREKSDAALAAEKEDDRIARVAALEAGDEAALSARKAADAWDALEVEKHLEEQRIAEKTSGDNVVGQRPEPELLPGEALDLNKPANFGERE
jgi:hypothetical protein